MNLKRHISDEIPIAPLIIFRVLFGLLMAFSIARFMWKGWISELYILPKFHFSYYGFEWVKTLPEGEQIPVPTTLPGVEPLPQRVVWLIGMDRKRPFTVDCLNGSPSRINILIMR